MANSSEHPQWGPVQPETFGAYLRRVREAAGVSSQRAAAAAANERASKDGLQTRSGGVQTVSYSLLAQYEADIVERPDPKVLRLLARVYDVDYMEMLLYLVFDKYKVEEEIGAALAAPRWNLWSAALTRFKAVGSVRASGLEELQLRAKATLVRHDQIHVLDMEGMARWQAEFPGLTEYWVVAPNFLDDTHEKIGRAAAKNLARGVHIVYFIRQEDADEGGRFWEAKRLLENFEPRVDSDILERQVHSVALDREILRWINTDLVIANPTPSPNQATAGFSTIRYRGVPILSTRLSDEDLRDVTNALRPFVKAHLARQYPFNAMSELPERRPKRGQTRKTK